MKRRGAEVAERAESPPPDPARGGDSPRLDSWKDIARYLQRDAATARRWEKSGLPVRRVAGRRGNSVYAYAAEIDEWLRAGDLTDQSAALPIERPQRSRLVLPMASLIVVLGVSALVMSLSRSARAPSDRSPRIARVELRPSAIESFDEVGRSLWRFDLPAAQRVAKSDTDDSVRIVGASKQTVFVGASMAFARDSNAVFGGSLFSFSAEGRLRWSFSAQDRVLFGGEAYGPPWPLTSFAVEDGAAPRTAVAFHHNNWNPSMVTILDDSGRRQGTFWHSGWIEQVRWLSSSRLLAAGFSNAHDGAMVALLDPSLPLASAPEPPGSPHRCGGCGPQGPVRMAVLPRSEVNLLSRSGFNRAHVELLPSRIVVHTVEIPSTGQGAADAIYEFDANLHLLSARFGERYWESHRALEAEGRLDHGRERCPWKDGPARILAWEVAAGWHEQQSRGRSAAGTVPRRPAAPRPRDLS